MKIGVFGDSYASISPVFDYPTWFEVLANHGHIVTSFGEGGSSLDYSIKKLFAYKDKFDFLILCVTEPNRVTIEIDEPPGVLHSVHILNDLDMPTYSLGITKKKAEAVKDYFKCIHDRWLAQKKAEGLVLYLLKHFPNLMIILNFDSPIFEYFHLHQIDIFEIKHWFPQSKNYREIFLKYHDMRRCHMCPENNRILGELVAKNLNPGIFTSDLSNFVLPTGTISQAFVPRS